MGFIFRFGRGESAEGYLMQKSGSYVCLFFTNYVYKILMKKKLRQKKIQKNNKTGSTIIRDFRVKLELVVGFGEKDTIHTVILPD